MTGPGELSGAQLRMMACTPITWALSCTRIAYLTYGAWCAYLTGLIEGDGNFNKNGLEISFDIRDVALAQAIRKRLRLPARTLKYRPGKRKDGSPGEGSYRLLVNHGDPAFRRVLNAVNGRFVGPFKIAQIIAYRHHEVFIGRCASSPRVKAQGWIPRPGLTLAPPDPNNARGWWITGFGDADMSAFLTWPECKFRVSFSQTDPTLLRAMQKYLRLPLVKALREKVGPDGKVRMVLEHQLVANHIDDQRRILHHYDRYPAQGVKGGHLYLLRQAYLIKARFYNRTHKRVSLYRRIRYARLWTIREALTLSYANGRWVYHAASTDPVVYRARGPQDNRRRSTVRGRIVNLSRNPGRLPSVAQKPER